MKYLAVICFFVFLFLSNCKNRTEDQQATPVTGEDSIEFLDTVLSEKDVAFLDQLNFSKYANSKGSRIDWVKFRMVTSMSGDSLQVSHFRPDSLFYQQYGRSLKYSPDSSMFIDLDSYNIEFLKSHKGRLSPIETGPDTEVSLINLDIREKTRLAFLGPGNGVEDAGWIDSNTAILIGYHEKDTSKLKKAVIWRYHVPTKTFHIYESADTSIAGQLLNWRKERFSKLF